jgi:hypothetical protein
MSCAEIRTALDALADGELDAAEERAARTHLAACAACARELEERRAFSESLGRSLERALDGVESSAADRGRAVGRMAAAARRRAPLLPRVAAVAAVGVAVGLVAWALASRPTPEQRDVARRLGEAEARDLQVRALREQASRELDFVREAVARGPADHPAAVALNVGLSALEDRLEPDAPRASLGQLVADTASPDPACRASAQKALWRLGAESLEEFGQAVLRAEKADWMFVTRVLNDLKGRARADASRQVAVSQVVNGESVVVSQGPDGRVRVVLPGRTIETRSMGELLDRHADVCGKYGIRGREGVITVGGSSATLDLEGRLQVLFRTGGWDEDALGEAYRSWAARGARDAGEVESRLKAMRERWGRAGGPPAPPPVDVSPILKDVKALTRPELEKIRAELEARMKKLDDDLRHAELLRTRAHVLRTFAEDLRKDR